ncbi:beta-ketoacyl-ACP synthase II [Helicobacter cinaedi]|uniref:3-oxoacyl-[acyl-carrier-protein] synthase 2 n=1 Tax=Helicobacter cinaedi CCUG 18818 = ATCC BAA-847 TaxID=537971 RepID=A0AAI8MLC1_9HELI|nr:beta-ketoacyl-ACP synthase II [Helicobacter cinaedi]AWK61270.1 beta-ketoacyl-[acyl-carrier-protein] synthase II [Helicobacter cinaedi]EFR47176.1 beta-ketoacyl-acyl-carrier-protein synthase II [Helicobacter cinaedi CCUG 18818 = ATCC BAA-847]QOQ90145.1 beta-ketoacyl-ACP synthase II [Helicobacter cinaedi]QOQ96329.1 beta-ketoacyl-ACP synthase II [Helicobacter cinaedi]BAM31703.1 3-oxoacyl-(acyl carrier protein) synthase II [Helicobacter cinaedi CCUG 18818 = ATCC BAA-847]
MRRVVVTGLGMINSLGLNKSDSFKAIVEGKCGIKRISCFDVENFPVKIAGEIVDFNPEEVLDPREVKKADRFIQLGLKAAKEAMNESGLLENGVISPALGERFGVSSAAGIGGLGNIEKNSIACEQKGPRRINPFFIPSALVNMLGGFISIEYALKGPNLASVTACAAGTHAIIEAAKTIMLNGADAMLVIGSESSICPVGIGGFAAMKALSDRNDEPLKASRPFDKERNGFVMGEGAGALVLEEYESAKKRGAKIYAELIGFGESGDANHITTPAPQGEGALRAMKAALKMANTSVDYINAHGTSTAYNDLYETMALKVAFGGKDSVPPVSSTKGQIGHCLGAAGAIEAVISIMAMQEGILPPTINQESKDPECDLDYIPNTARQAKVNAVMSNSFGFGGTNGVVIFGRI